MSTPSGKPDPQRAEQFLRDLVADDETRRLEEVSDEDYDAEVAQSGRDYSRVPTSD